MGGSGTWTVILCRPSWVFRRLKCKQQPGCKPARGYGTPCHSRLAQAAAAPVQMLRAVGFNPRVAALLPPCDKVRLLSGAVAVTDTRDPFWGLQRGWESDLMTSAQPQLWPQTFLSLALREESQHLTPTAVPSPGRGAWPRGRCALSPGVSCPGSTGEARVQCGALGLSWG